MQRIEDCQVSNLQEQDYDKRWGAVTSKIVETSFFLLDYITLHSFTFNMRVVCAILLKVLKSFKSILWIILHQENVRRLQREKPERCWNSNQCCAKRSHKSNGKCKVRLQVWNAEQEHSEGQEKVKQVDWLSSYVRWWYFWWINNKLDVRWTET